MFQDLKLVENFKIIDDFIDVNLCQNLIKQAQFIDNKKFLNIQGGNRYSLSNSSPFFKELLSKSSAWKDLNAKLTSNDFLKFCSSKLSFNSSILKSVFYYTDYNLKNNFFFKYKSLGLEQINYVSGYTLFKYSIIKILINIFRKFRYSKFFFLNKIPVELLFDYSRAQNGYSNRIHRDSDNRIIVFLLYLNTTSGSGGELGIYQKIDKEEFKLIDKVIPKPGRLVIFRNTDDTLHGAIKLENSENERCFVYGSYTSLNSKTNFFSQKNKDTKTEFYIYD